MYKEMRGLIKEHLKKSEDRLDALAHLNALIYCIVYEIHEEEKEVKKKEPENASQSQTR